MDKIIEDMSEKSVCFLNREYEIIKHLNPLEEQTLEEDIYEVLKQWKPRFEKIQRQISKKTKKIH